MRRAQTPEGAAEFVALPVILIHRFGRSGYCLTDVHRRVILEILS